MWYDVHEINIHAPGLTTYDAEGNLVRTWTTEVVRGRMTGGSERETAAFAQRGVSLDAVADVPLDTSVDTTYEVSCDDSAPTAALQGVRFRVIEVRPNLSHIRLMLTRTPPRG